VICPFAGRRYTIGGGGRAVTFEQHAAALWRRRWYVAQYDHMPGGEYTLYVRY
jgi:hypothetical protein